MNTVKFMGVGLFLFIFSSAVFASGSHKDGDMEASNYSTGKMIVHKQLMCSACPLKSENLNKRVAQDIISKLKQGDTSLGSFQRTEIDSVVAYLNYRFDM